MMIMSACVGGGLVIFFLLAPRMGPVVPALIAASEVGVGLMLFTFLRATQERQQKQRIAIDPEQGLFTLQHFVLHDGLRRRGLEEKVTIAFGEVREVKRHRQGTVIATAQGDFMLSPSWVGYEELVGTFQAMTGK